LKIYDIRDKNFSEVCIVTASAKKVRGIRCDPFNSHVIATFSDSCAESVKVWDLRRAHEAKAGYEPLTVPLVSIAGGLKAGSASASAGGIIDVQWCTHRQGILSVASTLSKDILFYDIERANQGPLFTVALPDTSDVIRAISWQRVSMKSTPKLLVASATGVLEAVIVESAPLAFGVSNILLFGSGQTLVSTQISVPEDIERVGTRSILYF
jgi:hypothetical protein